MHKNRWYWWHTMLMFLLVGALIVLAILPTAGSLVPTWLGGCAILLAMMAVASHGITRRWLGVLIDSRNRISLARLQIVLWTVVILPAIFSTVLGNVDAGSLTPLSFDVPIELWIVMGLSTATMIGSPLLVNRKGEKQPDNEEMAHQLDTLIDQGVDVKSVSSNGLILTYKRPSQARWSNLFRGEETGNAAQFDLARVQMLFITLILVIGYASALASLMSSGNVVTALPPVDDGMIALLTVSHAGYLTNKLVPHSKEQINAD